MADALLLTSCDCGALRLPKGLKRHRALAVIPEGAPQGTKRPCSAYLNWDLGFQQEGFQLVCVPPPVLIHGVRHREGGARGRLLCAAALPPAAELYSAVLDKLLTVVVFTIGLWPIGLMWVANLQMPVMNVAVQKTKEEWKQQLSPEQFKVLIGRGTERAGTSPYDKLWDDGTYACVGCGAPLFDAANKFDSGTG